MAVKRIAKRGCWVRPIDPGLWRRHRNTKYNAAVPMAIEAFTGKPFFETWVRLKGGVFRFSGFWCRQDKRARLEALKRDKGK